MRSPLQSTLFAGALALALGVACSADDGSKDVPVRTAPPSRHGAFVDELANDAHAFAFTNGDWDDDLGDAPFYGVAWLSHRAASGRLDADGIARRDAALVRSRTVLQGALLDGDIQDKVMAALGLIDHVGTSRDRTLVPAIDEFVDRLDGLTSSLGDYLEVGAERSWALRTYGPTAVTALIALVQAQYALSVGGDRARERLERAIALDGRIREKAHGDLVDASTGRSVRGYAFAPGRTDLIDYPNLAMLLLKARLFRLTKDEVFRLEARAVYVALQPLKLSDSPARYSSPYAKGQIGVDTRDLSTLSSQNYLALGLMLLFEITGEQRFVDEADRVIDGIAAMRGPWCESNVRARGDCAPACSSGQACRASGACLTDTCTTGLLHHVVDGRLAQPADGTVFCSGCNLQTLYVTGYRRMLAGEPF